MHTNGGGALFRIFFFKSIFLAVEVGFILAVSIKKNGSESLVSKTIVLKGIIIFFRILS